MPTFWQLPRFSSARRRAQSRSLELTSRSKNTRSLAVVDQVFHKEMYQTAVPFQTKIADLN